MHLFFFQISYNLSHKFGLNYNNIYLWRYEEKKFTGAAASSKYTRLTTKYKIFG